MKALLIELRDKAKRQWKTLLLIALVPWGIFIASGAVLGLMAVAFGLVVGGVSMMQPDAELLISTFLGGGAVPAIFVLAFIVVNAIATIVSGVSLIHACLHPEADVKQCYEAGIKLWKTVLWVGILAGFASLGGAYLLVIPGLVIGVMLAFAEYTAVDEGKKGMDALMRSRELVKGRGWSVLLATLVMSFVVAIPSLILSALADPKGNDVFSTLSSVYEGLVAMPLYVLVGIIIYQHLKKLPSLAGPEGNARKVYKSVAIFGVIGIPVPLLILGMILGAAGFP